MWFQQADAFTLVQFSLECVPDISGLSDRISIRLQSVSNSEDWSFSSAAVIYITHKSHEPIKYGFGRTKFYFGSCQKMFNAGKALNESSTYLPPSVSLSHTLVCLSLCFSVLSLTSSVCQSSLFSRSPFPSTFHLFILLVWVRIKKLVYSVC